MIEIGSIIQPLGTVAPPKILVPEALEPFAKNPCMRADVAARFDVPLCACAEPVTGLAADQFLAALFSD